MPKQKKTPFGVDHAGTRIGVVADRIRVGQFSVKLDGPPPAFVASGAHYGDSLTHLHCNAGHELPDKLRMLAEVMKHTEDGLDGSAEVVVLRRRSR